MTACPSPVTPLGEDGPCPCQARPAPAARGEPTPGTYQIELGFSEWTNTKAGKRVFDVKVNGAYAIVGKDIITEVPVLTANLNTVVVEHDGGDLRVELVPRKAMDSPVINTLKVQERADL